MKPKNNKALKKAEEKRIGKEKETALVKWFVKVIVAKTLKDIEEKNEDESNNQTSNF